MLKLKWEELKEDGSPWRREFDGFSDEEKARGVRRLWLGCPPTEGECGTGAAAVVLWAVSLRKSEREDVCDGSPWIEALLAKAEEGNGQLQRHVEAAKQGGLEELLAALKAGVPLADLRG